MISDQSGTTCPSADVPGPSERIYPTWAPTLVLHVLWPPIQQHDVTAAFSALQAQGPRQLCMVQFGQACFLMHKLDWAYSSRALMLPTKYWVPRFRKLDCKATTSYPEPSPTDASTASGWGFQRRLGHTFTGGSTRNRPMGY